MGVADPHLLFILHTQHHMDLSNINSVADLVLENERAQSPTERAIDALTNVGCEDSMRIARWLVANLKDWHHDIAMKLAKNGEAHAAWVFDESKLATALDLLQQVDVSFNDNNSDD